MILRPYENRGSDPTHNAQENLSGRSHYVSPGNLCYHHSRILDSGEHSEGLLFWLIESCSLDFHNRERGFRFVVFDLAGTVIERANLTATYSTRKAADKALRSYLATMTPAAVASVTAAAIARSQRNTASEIKDARTALNAAIAKLRKSS